MQTKTQSNHDTREIRLTLGNSQCRENDVTLLISRSDVGSRILVAIELLADADFERPLFWTSFGKALEQKGFRADTSWVDDNGETFLPTSFFSAVVSLAGEKHYDVQHIADAVEDVQGILDTLPTAPKSVRSMETPSSTFNHAFTQGGPL